MENLYPLERAALEAIARQVPDHTDALSRQLMHARVVARRNIGVGFYTTLDTSSDATLRRYFPRWRRRRVGRSPSARHGLPALAAGRAHPRVRGLFKCRRNHR
jgi:hypothetical protein